MVEEHVNQNVKPGDEVVPEPASGTAGEEDHTDPDMFRGEPADAPEETGKPAQED